ncbi:MAG TPA: cytochrome b/b6 domain-containing protein [Burkholderiaceae bacterium]|nr:cytochrome b/b6 domain-containing protein [Burkholderiaceae bacterium]
MADSAGTGALPPDGRRYVFRRFERFWHWAQAALILVLLFTGFAVHGTHHAIRFGTAASWHTLAAWALMGLWVFAAFWHATTGEWRQYVPTTDRLVAMVRWYAWGIFHDVPHPYRATVLRKHNPLQRLAYLVLLAVISPLIWASGLLYLFRGAWDAPGAGGPLTLERVAWAHTAGAFLMLAFLVAHVYLATTGRTPLAHFRAMVTGWEETDGPSGDDRTVRS